MDGTAAHRIRSEARAVAISDPEYPDRLRDLRVPPRVVYLLGPWAPRRASVAIVGARDATGDGRDVARLLAADLARAGFDVLSGLARGIDAAAHEGSLDAGGRSGAVLGTGIDGRYPRENASLHDRLVGSLGLLSELPPGAAPTRSTFASRNRLLAALSDAVVVVQGRESSGALITAREALRLGRPVGAVPWDAREPLGAAPHALVRAHEAVLVRSAADVIELLGSQPSGHAALQAPPGAPATLRPFASSAGPRAGALSPTARRLLDALRDRPQSLDALAERAELNAGDLAAALVALELLGLARREPGGQARRSPRA